MITLGCPAVCWRATCDTLSTHTAKFDQGQQREVVLSGQPHTHNLSLWDCLINLFDERGPEKCG